VTIRYRSRSRSPSAAATRSSCPARR
jgi:hypothetical protein